MVLRSAKPTVDPVAAVFTRLPSGDGFDKGAAPTDSTVPTTIRTTKYARSRQRRTKAARKAVAGRAKLTATSHSDVMYGAAMGR